MNDSLSPPGPVQPRRRAVVVTGVVVILLGLVAFAAERGWRDEIRADARAEVGRVLSGYAAAVELAVAEYAVVVDGLAAWIRSRPEATSAEFRRDAATLHEARPDILTLNRIRGSVITDVFPVEPNLAALGLDLATHPDTAPPAALRRAIETGETTIGGPVPLAQGGDGLLLFRVATRTPDQEPSTAEVVVVLDTLLAGTGIAELADDLDLHIFTADGRRVAGARLPPDADPVEVTIDFPDGGWTLAAAPPRGWSAGVGDRIWTTRGILLALVLLAGTVVFGAVDRQERLAAAVSERTADLRVANEKLERTAEELAAQRELRYAAMSAGRVDVWSWDLDRDVVERAGALLDRHGRPRSEHTADLIERVHPDDRKLVREHLDEARRSGTIALEFRERVRGGEWAWLRVEGHAVDFRDGRPTRLLGAGADISKLKELEAEVLHHDRLELIGQLAGGVVHDINNALSVVLGELDMALENDPRFSVRDAAVEARTAARYASVLTGQLLTFARKDHVVPTVFEWDPVCEEASAFIDRVLGAGIRLLVDPGAAGAAVRMDRTQAMQILANLATNARDAMDGSGRMRISTRRVEDGSSVSPEAGAGPAVVTEVSDSGYGIPEAVQDRIFDAFFTTKGKDRGTGLGLSTTRRIAREAGGDVVFETSPNGTTFFVVIPIVESA